MKIKKKCLEIKISIKIKLANNDYIIYINNCKKFKIFGYFLVIL